MKKKDFERAKGVGRKYYREVRGRDHTRLDSVVYTSILFEGEWYRVENKACHKGLHKWFFSGDQLLVARVQRQKAVATISLLPHVQTEGPAAASFYQWLFNESPYRSVFMNSSYKSALDYGIITRTNKPSNLMLGGLIASRIPTEFGDRLPLWYALVKRGCDKNLAFVLCHCASLEGGRVGYNVLCGHNALEMGEQSLSAIRNFIVGKLVNPQATYDNTLQYTGVTELWGVAQGVKCAFLKNIERIRRSRREVEGVFGLEVRYSTDVDTWCSEAMAIGKETFNV